MCSKYRPLIAGLGLAALLAGCSGQRPAVDSTTSAPAMPDSLTQPDTDTCATWVGQRFKGQEFPDQVRDARASWAQLLMYEATGRELDDSDYDASVRVSDLLSGYCPAHLDQGLVIATDTVMRAAGIRVIGAPIPAPPTSAP